MDDLGSISDVELMESAARMPHLGPHRVIKMSRVITLEGRRHVASAITERDGSPLSPEMTCELYRRHPDCGAVRLSLGGRMHTGVDKTSGARLIVWTPLSGYGSWSHFTVNEIEQLEAFRREAAQLRNEELTAAHAGDDKRLISQVWARYLAGSIPERDLARALEAANLG